MVKLRAIIFSPTFKGGWPEYNVTFSIARHVAAGVVDFLDFKMFHNAASAEVDLFLRDDLKDLRPFLLNRLKSFICYKVKKNSIDQPPRPGKRL